MKRIQVIAKAFWIELRHFPIEFQENWTDKNKGPNGHLTTDLVYMVKFNLNFIFIMIAMNDAF